MLSVSWIKPKPIQETIVVNKDTQLTDFEITTLPDESWASDAMPNDGIEIAGRVEVGASVELVMINQATQESQTIQVKVDASGQWQANLPPLSEGNFTWQVTATDKLGNTQQQSGQIQINPPPAPPVEPDTETPLTMQSIDDHLESFPTFDGIATGHAEIQIDITNANTGNLTS